MIQKQAISGVCLIWLVFVKKLFQMLLFVFHPFKDHIITIVAVI